MRKLHSWLLAAVLVLGLAGAASAEDADEGNVFAHQKLGIPVYDPEAKRYFMFMKSQNAVPSQTMWDSVSKQASAQAYKGVRGRLAIVDTPEVHQFLWTTFKPNHYQYVWIGLRYLCRAKHLEWSDGTLWKPGMFQIWDAQWNQDVYTCSEKGNPNDWAPVAYTPSMKSWVVKGNHKGYDYYFMEFPTGHE